MSVDIKIEPRATDRCAGVRGAGLVVRHRPDTGHQPKAAQLRSVGVQKCRPKAVAAASRTVLILWSTIAEVCAGAAADKLQEAPSSIALAQ